MIKICHIIPVILIFSFKVVQDEKMEEMSTTSKHNCTLINSAHTKASFRDLNASNAVNCIHRKDKLVDFCSDYNVNGSKVDIVYAIMLTLLILIGIIGNITVCVIVLKDTELRAEVINWFLFSLAVSDILVCSTSFPFRVDENLHNQSFCFGLHACYFWSYIDIVSGASSVICLFWISISRYLAVAHPFK